MCKSLKTATNFQFSSSLTFNSIIYLLQLTFLDSEPQQALKHLELSIFFQKKKQQDYIFIYRER